MSASPVALLDDHVLHLILHKAVATDPPCLHDLLSVCHRFRTLLLASATAASITADDFALLPHCGALRSITLACGCSRLPWFIHTHNNNTLHLAPPELSRLASLTRVDALDAALSDFDMRALRCLPSLQHLRVSKGVTLAGLQQLTQMASLRHLDISGCAALTAASLAELSHLESLHSLDIHGPAFGPENRLDSSDSLAGLATLTSLRGLNLSHADWAVRAGLHPLTALTGLETLDLSCNSRLMHPSLAFVSRLTRLRALNLQGCSALDFNRGLERVAGLAELTELRFHDCKLHDEGLAHLMRLTALTALDLSHCVGISETGFAWLCFLKSLRRLSLVGVTHVPISAVLVHLGGLKHLQEVEIDVDAVDDAALAQLCDLRALRRVALSRHVTVHGLAHLTKLSALEGLCLADFLVLNDLHCNEAFMHVHMLTALTRLDLDDGFLPSLSDDGLAQLSTLSRLRSLELRHCDLLTDGGLKSLGGMSGLTRLRLRDCAGLSRPALPRRLLSLDLGGCSALTDSSLAVLSGLHSVAALSLRGCTQLSDAALTHLRDLTTLTELSLRGCKRLTGGGLAHLARLRVLKAVDLSRCVSLEGGALAAVSELRGLTSLDLSHCTLVAEDALSHLAQLPRLEVLALPVALLTHAGVAQIARIKSLSALDLRESGGVSEECALELTSLVGLERVSLPDGTFAAVR